MSQQSADKFLQGQLLLATFKEIWLKPAKHYVSVRMAYDLLKRTVQDNWYLQGST